MTTLTTKHSSNCTKCAICQCRCCINKRSKWSRIQASFTQTDTKPNDREHRRILILVRHGSSQDDIDKRFSGWNDCDLSNIGEEQMHRTGQALRQANISIDLCYTSVLKRAIKSLFIIQEEMDYLWLPVYNIWRLNDRMLGSLTGFHRERAEALFGQNQIKEWLIQSELAPPILDESSVLHPRTHYKYRNISSIVPSTETLSDIRKRLLPFFYDHLLHNLYLGKNILVVTHEDIVKAIIRLLNDYTIDAFVQQLIPIGIPIIFEFSLNNHEFFNSYYLPSTLFEVNSINQFFPIGSINSQRIKSSQEINVQHSMRKVDSKASTKDLIHPEKRTSLDTFNMSVDMKTASLSDATNYIDPTTHIAMRDSLTQELV